MSSVQKMTVEEVLKSFGLLTGDGELYGTIEEYTPAFDMYAQCVAHDYNEISDQFLEYLDKEINDYSNSYTARLALISAKGRFQSLLNK